MAGSSGYGVRNGYVYYAYMPVGPAELSEALGAARIEFRDGGLVGAYYLAGERWVWDMDVARDLSGVGGTSHMRPITESELRNLIETEFVRGVDPDKLLCG